MSSNAATIHHNILNGHAAVHNDYPPPLHVERQRLYTTRKSNRSMRRLKRATSTTTSSALALLAFLFFLNVLQRSLDDNKQQGPIVMTRTTTPLAIIPRNDFTKNKQQTLKSTSRDNTSVTKFENIFNKYLK